MIPMIDLFAGPGGLSEGFSSVLDGDGKPRFSSVMSVERDPQAHKTLRLRSYFRKIYYTEGKIPESYFKYMKDQSPENLTSLISYRPDLWDDAGTEAICAELRDDDDSLVNIARQRLRAHGVGVKGAGFQANESKNPWVLLGGPPCQAYSLAGRSRRAHDTSLEDDEKQTLYQCYLQFIRELQPTVFVMENVKGLLSARRKGESLFQLIKSDMEAAGYVVKSLVARDPKEPADFVIRSENYGVPQKRHRVILLGVKQSVEGVLPVLSPTPEVSLKDVFHGIPALRSSFSNRTGSKNQLSWHEFLKDSAQKLVSSGAVSELNEVLTRVGSRAVDLPTSAFTITSAPVKLANWYRGRIGTRRVLPNHHSRTHQPSDIVRYLFCSAFAEVNGVPARIADFPNALLPDHKNLRDLDREAIIKFNDRFRVQLWDQPSTTITAHISKDGHYYIHPQPEQARSLSVREAARLQTFPDDYIFEGNRTSQYTQVGNAVPPLLAMQIAEIVLKVLNL